MYGKETRIGLERRLINRRLGSKLHADKYMMRKLVLNSEIKDVFVLCTVVREVGPTSEIRDSRQWNTCYLITVGINCST